MVSLNLFLSLIIILLLFFLIVYLIQVDFCSQIDYKHILVYFPKICYPALADIRVLVEIVGEFVNLLDNFVLFLQAVCTETSVFF